MRIAIRLAVLLALAAPLAADVIELRSGERIEDEVLSFDGQTFTLKDHGAIPASDVKEELAKHLCDNPAFQSQLGVLGLESFGFEVAG